jgi:hypothetical protein
MSIIPLDTQRRRANGDGPLDFPGQRKQSHLETATLRERASISSRPISPTEKSSVFNRRAQHLRPQCDRRSLRTHADRDR